MGQNEHECLNFKTKEKLLKTFACTEIQVNVLSKLKHPISFSECHFRLQDRFFFFWQNQTFNTKFCNSCQLGCSHKLPLTYVA